MNTRSILVCGGAGYIGSDMVRLLVERGLDVTVFDNLSTGHAQAVGAARLVQGDVLDAAQAIPYTVEPRRPGDPATLVASAERAQACLGWMPAYQGIEEIIETAWR